MISDARRAWPARLAGVAVAVSCATLAGAATSPKKSPWTLVLGVEAEARYDDNIIGLSKRDIDRLDNPAIDPEDRYGVESEDDVIFAPDVFLRFSREPRGGLDTDVTLRMRVYDYVRNSKKDYEQYSFSVRQDLNRSREHGTALTVGGASIPSYFLRRLVDDDESDPNAGLTVRNDADYDLTRAYVEINQEIVDRLLSVSGRYARERRNYNHHFNERDASSNVFSLDVDIYPTRRIGFRVRPYYEHESRETRGDVGSSTTVTDDDVGFDSDLVGLDLRWLWGPDRDHRSVLNVYAQVETREFTSQDASDTGHYGREDDITRYGAGYSRELSRAWKWSVSAYHRENDVTTESGTTTFRKNVAALAISYRFERRLGGPASGRK